MHREQVIERFFNTLIGGQRDAARQMVDQLLEADCPAETILSQLFWPTLEHIQNLHRNDQLADLAHHYATRLLRTLTDQMQMRLTQGERRGRRLLLVCGPDEPEELAGQMAADLLEADGYDVFFAGGGIANDEIIAQLGELQADLLVVFGALPSTVPFTRLLIDHLHEIGICPNLQIAVGGGVFNRAEGLAEEIGADLWARDPEEMVRVINDQPRRRMSHEQRTVGRRRRTNKSIAAA
ncbi:MAG: cobalamin-dependent protein [Phycisphaeraceae bacterium]|nr:cobalamin-dependent protein [Phycisphaeraceae bacterium]